jgi:hypothetical protein
LASSVFPAPAGPSIFIINIFGFEGKRVNAQKLAAKYTGDSKGYSKKINPTMVDLSGNHC